MMPSVSPPLVMAERWKSKVLMRGEEERKERGEETKRERRGD